MAIVPKVGVFDSGIGGLTVLSSCMKRFPEALYYYYGDNARAPYGSRSSEEITFFVREALDIFSALQVDAVVLACNTATAVCIEEMRRLYSFPIIGVEPAVKQAALQCRNVLILATPRTAGSERLNRLIRENSACQFTVHASQGLAGAIENALVKREPFCLAEYLPIEEYDGVVLGCTHYTFFRNEISSFFNAPVFEGNEGVARRLCSLFLEEKVITQWKSNTKTNRCLRREWSESIEKRVIFLGSSAEINQKIFEQTFEYGDFN